MSHSTQHAAQHGHDDVASHLPTYWKVFWALIAGTVITVALYSVHFESVAVTIAIAMFVASIKAFLVAGYFMHLLSEKKMIYGILAATVFFLIGLMALTIWGSHDQPNHTERKTFYVP
jgi:cytochrome c oxidase subunit 4